MPIPVFSICMMLAVVACNKSTPLPPQHQNVVNATRVEAPVPPGTGNVEAALNGAQGNIYAVEQPPAGQVKPEQMVARFGGLLHQHDFKAAYALWGPNPTIDEKSFEKQFDGYRTIDAAIGKIGPTEGAAGSLYSIVQLTLSGNRKDGSPYAITGPVTLRRVNDVPGSTAAQRQWHIEKMELTASAKAAKSIVK
jgi:hypothetical protein